MFEVLKAKFNTAINKIKSKVLEKEISSKDLDNILWDLQIGLLEADVALEVSDAISLELKETLLGKKVKRFKIKETIKNALINFLEKKLDIPSCDLIEVATEKKKKKSPLVIVFIGVNGTGKTTTIAKIAWLLQKYNFSVVLAASDTFRAAAIDQLEKHAKNLNLPVIKHDYGADSAAVCYDAIQHAKARKIDVVLVDTAGRMQTNINLMEELKKVCRVNAPDMILFVGDSLIGNDAIEQIKMFNTYLDITGVILTKMDVNPRGGSAISITYVTKKPILYVGTGQNYEDLHKFNARWFINKLGLE
jgi:fused signal recognition particle receptor